MCEAIAEVTTFTPEHNHMYVLGNLIVGRQPYHFAESSCGVNLLCSCTSQQEDVDILFVF